MPTWPCNNDAPARYGAPECAMSTRRPETRNALPLFGCLLLLVLSAGCQSAPKQAPDLAHDESTRAVMLPAQAEATLHFHSGRFPNLFAGDSQAYWLDALTDDNATGHDILLEMLDSDELARQQKALHRDALLIVCRFVSRFTDPSISYDAVRLRGVQTQLLLPDGHSVAPLHTRVAGETAGDMHSESPGFYQTHYLAFPRSVLDHLAAIHPAETKVRLMLKGYDTTYYFAWEIAVIE